MGLGAALGAGAAGASVGLVAGPVGAVTGGLLGLVVGAFLGGGGDAAGGAASQVDPGFNAGWQGDALPTVPVTSGGPSGGGPLAPFVPTSPPPTSAPIETRPDPMTIGGAPATDVNALSANLNRARGGFLHSGLKRGSGATSAPKPWLSNAANKALSGGGGGGAVAKAPAGWPAAYVPTDSAPVEAIEEAREMVQAKSRIPPPNPTTPMMATSKGALEDAVKQSFLSRSANVTSGRVLSKGTSGPASQPRSNAGTKFTPGPPASPSAQGTQFAPVEAIENVQEAAKQVAARTTDRFAGMGAKGRSNVAFRTKQK